MSEKAINPGTIIWQTKATADSICSGAEANVASLLPGAKKWRDAKAGESYNFLFSAPTFCQDGDRRTTTGTAVASLLIEFLSSDVTTSGDCETFKASDTFTVGDLVRIHRQHNQARMDQPISSATEAGVADTETRSVIVRLVPDTDSSGDDKGRVLSRMVKLSVHTDLFDVNEEAVKDPEPVTYTCKGNKTWASLFDSNDVSDVGMLYSIVPGSNGWSGRTTNTELRPVNICDPHLEMQGSDGSTETGFAQMRLKLELSPLSRSTLSGKQLKKIPVYQLPSDHVTMRDAATIFTTLDKSQIDVPLTYPATPIPVEGKQILLVRQQNPLNRCHADQRTQVADISISGVVGLKPKGDGEERGRG